VVSVVRLIYHRDKTLTKLIGAAENRHTIFSAKSVQKFRTDPTETFDHLNFLHERHISLCFRNHHKKTSMLRPISQHVSHLTLVVPRLLSMLFFLNTKFNRINFGLINGNQRGCFTHRFASLLPKNEKQRQ
jgi:hypothetical protein